MLCGGLGEGLTTWLPLMPSNIDVQVARLDEQLKELTRRFDFWAKVMFAVFVAVLGSAVSFLFVVLTQLSG